MYIATVPKVRGCSSSLSFVWFNTLFNSRTAMLSGYILLPLADKLKLSDILVQ